MTSIETLVCQAQQIRKCLGCSQDLEMAAIIYYLGLLTGVSTDCTTLNNGAAQYACIPRQSQLSVVIFLLSQLLSGNTVGGFVFAGNYGGNPPPFSPLTTGAIGIDSVTGRQWQWSGGSWS